MDATDPPPPEPRVSVVIPAYGHADLIAASVRSALDQTYPDREVIVVNDGSPDDTADVLAPLVRSGEIRYVEQPNAGQATARNRGLGLARGRYVAFLDDDDVWPADKLAWQVAALDADPAAVLVYGFVELTGTGGGARFPGPDGPAGDVLDRFLSHNWIRSPGQTLIRRTALDRVGGFDPALWGTDDWDLYLRLADVGPFAYEHRLALRYHCHPGNASNNFWRMYVNARRVLRKRFGILPRPGQVQRWHSCRRFVRRFTGDDAARAAAERARGGHLRAATIAWAQLAWIDPSRAVSRPIVTSAARRLIRAVRSRMAKHA